MKKWWIWIAVLAMVMVLGGCCSTDTSKIAESIALVDSAAQPFYVPAIEGNTEAQMAIAAANAAAAVALALKDQWCPPQATVNQAVRMAGDVAKSLAVSKKELTRKGVIKP